MSKIFVDQVDPKTSTTLTLGTTGDTVSIPTGVTLSGAGTITASAANLAASGAGGVTGTLPIANGGTGATTLAAAGLSNTPNFMIRQASATSLTDATRTKVGLDTAIIDTDSGLDAGNEKWVVPSGKGGTYLITYSLRYESSADFDDCNVIVYKNGAALHSVWGGNTFYNTFTASFIAVLAAADYLEMYGLQSSGGAINASTSDWGVQTYLGGVRLTL